MSVKKEESTFIFSNFPGVEETVEVKDQRITERLWYMGFSKKHLETLQDLNPVISPLLDELLQKVLDHLYKQSPLKRIADNNTSRIGFMAYMSVISRAY
ncbi:protoglobin domain-containing protein [Bacillus sp. 22-7]|uniref:protoglobin domain-containing protein n=1 Tax=Bacillus sp. 22-7 TaxID=2709707 RepID=UPI0013D710BF